jgi:glycosyltransferase involved in cell wall biosynthesis
MTRVYVNGKFLAQAVTGVQRSAREWLNAIDALLAASPVAASWTVLHPPGVCPPAWKAIEARAVGMASRPLHLWEQVMLPLAARDGLLLNLAGSAPWYARVQVATLHDAAVFDHPEAYTLPFRWWYRRLFRHLAAGSGRLVTVSAFSRHRLAAALGVPPQRFDVVPNGGDHFSRVEPDPRVLHELGLAGQRFLLAVASANPNKNMARLGAAFDLACQRDPALRLVLVGGRRGRVFADTAVPRSERVVDAGMVDDGRLKALYEAAVGAVVPSLYEGFGMPALEAMSCGCPVLAASAGALPEVCGDAALYADPLSVDGLAQALGCLAGDAGLRERLRGAGLARAALFRWQEGGRGLLDMVKAAA